VNMISLYGSYLDAVGRSFLVSGWAILIATVLGISLALLISLHDFKLKKIVITFINTWTALPAVSIGLIVYILLSSRGPLGNFHLLFTVYAMIIAQALLATPLVCALSLSALSAIAPEIRETALTLGANKFQLIATILREAKYPLVTAVIVAFSRLLGETGMTLMVGGNIKGYTRVMTTAIALETMKGNFEVGITLGIILIIWALLLNIVVQLIQHYIR